MAASAVWGADDTGSCVGAFSGRYEVEGRGFWYDDEEGVYDEYEKLGMRLGRGGGRQRTGTNDEYQLAFWWSGTEG